MPKELIRPGPVTSPPQTLDPADLAACGERLTSLQRAFPQARFDRIIRRLTEMDAADFQRLPLP